MTGRFVDHWLVEVIFVVVGFVVVVAVVVQTIIRGEKGWSITAAFREAVHPLVRWSVRLPVRQAMSTATDCLTD